MQLDSKESADSVFHIDDAQFPFTAKCPARIYECKNYSDVSDMLLNPIAGLTLIQHARTLAVQSGDDWKTISLESLANNPAISFFMIAYARATSDYIKGFLFTGDIGNQPNILYGEGQAFDVIRNSITECEIDNIRTTRQQINFNDRQ